TPPVPSGRRRRLRGAVAGEEAGGAVASAGGGPEAVGAWGRVVEAGARPRRARPRAPAAGRPRGGGGGGPGPRGGPGAGPAGRREGGGDARRDARDGVKRVPRADARRDRWGVAGRRGVRPALVASAAGRPRGLGRVGARTPPGGGVASGRPRARGGACGLRR